MSNADWLRNRDIMPSLIDPICTFSQIWEPPEGIFNYNDMVLRTLKESLEAFLEEYADPDEADDDGWYYNNLSNYLYEMKEDPLKGDSLARADYERYRQDPVRAMTLLCETIGSLFEEVVMLNREAIENLYATCVIKGITVQINANHIALVIRGMRA